MIEITFFKRENLLTGIKSQGHSGFKSKGHDVICAAVSVLMQSLYLGLTEIAKINLTENIINENTPIMFFKWNVQDCEKIFLLANTVYESLKIIASQNPGFIKILEVSS